MKFPQLFCGVALLGALLTVSACSLFSPESSVAPKHPEALPAGRPACSECHEGQQLKGALKPYAAYDHTATFVTDHRFAAGIDRQVCATCHASSFCTDCHAIKIEIKPSTLYGDRPDRDLPHRGDYLTRHRFDGKIDPASCYKCHGRSNNQMCMNCHK